MKTGPTWGFFTQWFGDAGAGIGTAHANVTSVSEVGAVVIGTVGCLILGDCSFSDWAAEYCRATETERHRLQLGKKFTDARNPACRLAKSATSSRRPGLPRLRDRWLRPYPRHRRVRRPCVRRPRARRRVPHAPNARFVIWVTNPESRAACYRTQLVAS